MEFCALKKIGYVLRFYRRRRDLSQIQMADALGISPRNYQRIEGSEVEPKLETLIQIARVLEIPVSSLIRPASCDQLSIQDVSSSAEKACFQDIDLQMSMNNQDLQYAQTLVDRDRMILPTPELAGRIEGTVATLSSSLATLIGISGNKIDVQPHVMLGSIIERWEAIYRNKITRAVIENMYSFPRGVVALQVFHHNLNAEPCNPTSDIYVRDITARQNLEHWIKKVQKSHTCV